MKTRGNVITKRKVYRRRRPYRRSFERAVKRVINKTEEHKYLNVISQPSDITQYSLGVGGYGAFWDIIPKGTAVGERVGNKVYIKGSYMRGLIYMNVGSSVSGASIVTRLTVMLVRPPNTMDLSVNVDSVYDVLNAVSRDYAIINPQVHYTHDSIVKVLFDRNFHLQGGQKTQIAFRKYLRINKLFKYSSSNLNQPDNLRLVVVMSSTNGFSGGAAQVSCQVYNKTIFTDA